MKRATIYSRFKYHVEKHPDASAIIEDSRSVTYRELDSLVNDALRGFYYKGHNTIGIVMSHGIDMIAAILAVLKSGAAYVPAEPSLPAERIDYMMKAAGADFVITDKYFENLPHTEKDFPDKSKANKAAYILFTSGTTGKPKGVIVANHSVVNYSEAFESEFGISEGDVMLQYSVCSFDIFVEEVFASLLNGAAIAIPSPEIMAGDISTLMKFVENHRISIISGFPYLLAEINKLKSIPASLRLLISGGDVLREGYIDKLRNKGVKIYNTYGPSETTVCASYYRCDNAESFPDGTYPIGREVKGVKIKILNNKLKELPVGKTGEICIYGEGVSLGYLGNPPEQSNFVDCKDGERMYRSGDLGYRDKDGNIVFLHRKDKQVMILGKRVEPEEVENVLNGSPEIEKGVVCSYSDDRGLSYLVAYFVPKGPKFSLKAIKKWLASKLTDFMIPEFFVAMKSIPITVRGKIDRSALPVILKEGDKPL